MMFGFGCVGDFLGLLRGFVVYFLFLLVWRLLASACVAFDRFAVELCYCSEVVVYCLFVVYFGLLFGFLNVLLVWYLGGLP